MKRSFIRRAATVAAVAVALIAATSPLTATEAAVERKIRLVQVLHRHGARAGQPTYNQTELCTEAPCGYLSEAGLTMLQRVGAFLRARYNTDATVVDEPMFPSEDYDLDAVYSRSTDVLRTLQSAEAFLRGFFPNQDTLFPAIHTQPESFDMLLNSNAVPWLRYFYRYNTPLLNKIGNPPCDELFPDWTELTAIGASAFSEARCGTQSNRSSCAREMFDLAAAKLASGQISSFPLLLANYEKLQTITRAVFDYEYHFDKSEDLHLRQGGRGQPFVQELLTNIANTIAKENTFPMMHYSAHDTTLAPVWGTLADRTDNGMLPLFAQALVCELLEDAADGSFHVRLLRGHPGQSPDTNFEFVWDDTWAMRCVDSLGVMYTATDNTCPLADFERLVKWSEPADLRGLCYLDEESVAMRDCPEWTATAGAASDGPELPAACVFYRSHCPEFACEFGCVLDSITYQCVCKGFRDNENSGGDGSTTTITPTTTTAAPPGDDTASKRGVSGGAAAGIAIATFCVGSVFAALITAFACITNRGRKYEAAELA